MPSPSPSPNWRGWQRTAIRPERFWTNLSSETGKASSPSRTKTMDSSGKIEINLDHPLSTPCDEPSSLLEARRNAAPLSREARSEEHTSELQSLMRISYAVFCLKKKNNTQTNY